MFTKSYSAFLKVHGPNHPLTQNAKSSHVNISNVLADMGSLKRRLLTCKGVLRLSSSSLGAST
jgi:hypothetical protein